MFQAPCTLVTSTSVTTSSANVTAFTHVGTSGPGVGSVGGVANNRIAFTAADSPDTLATNIAAAITAANMTASGIPIVATAYGASVELAGLPYNKVNPLAPLNFVPGGGLLPSSFCFGFTPINGAGGNITGLTVDPNYVDPSTGKVAPAVLAVDDRGGLYVIDDGWANVNGVLTPVPLNPYAAPDAAGSTGLWGFVPLDNTATLGYGTWVKAPAVNGINPGPFVTEIGSVLKDSNGNFIQFSGLTVGPQNVENGKYKDLLFAVDGDAAVNQIIPGGGNLYAIDPDGTATTPAELPGTLYGAMLDARHKPPDDELRRHRSVSACCAALNNVRVKGIAFTNEDINLWHETILRKNDPGHGINATSDFSRVGQEGYPTNGGHSMYFGLETPNVHPPVANPSPLATTRTSIRRT